MRKKVNDRPAQWRKCLTVAAMSFVLAVCGLFQSLAAVPVSAGTTDAIDGQELTNSKEVSSLISDTWEEDYFGSITVDTEAGKVETDGETEKLDEVIQTPDASDGSEENVTIQQHAAGEKDTAESDPLLEEYIDTLPGDTLYTVEETENGEYEVTAPFQTKRLIVETMQLTDDYDATEVYYNTELNETILEFATEEDTKEAFDAICQKYGEESCYPDEIYYVDDILADDASLSSGTSYSWGTAYMGMNTLKAQAEGKYGAVTVAILDTGIDRSNFMFQSRTISPQSYNFIDANKNVSDNHGHGTHVAGIIADSTPGNVQFLILKISNSSGYSSLLTIKTALQYALNRNVSVVNMSLGFVGVNAMSITYLDSLINRAYRNGIAISCASGNNGVDVSYCYPACNSKTLAVSSFGQNERAASYSNHGSRIDFSAPGTGIVSAAANGFLVGMTGTSMSAPHITAAVAYLKMMQPNLSVPGVYHELQARCRDLGTPGRDEYFGWGCPILTNLLQEGILNANNVVAPGSGTATPLLKKVKSTDDGIRVAWGKVKKADRYVIYRRKGNGSLKKVRTVSGSTKAWTDRNVSQGIRYSYAVKAVKNGESGSRSAEKAAVYLKQPQKMRTIRKNSGTAVIKWAKLARVSGYQIRYAGKRTMKNAATVVLSGSKTRAVLKGLGKKTYYCQVRAYKNVGGVQYTSPWSAVKRIAKK